MAEADALAQVYARSLYELADEAGGHDKIFEIGDELEQICELTRAEREFAELLSSPIIDVARRNDSLRRLFSDRITDLTLRFLLVLNEKGRLSHLESVTTAFERLVQEAHGRVEVDVFTPTPIDTEQRERLTERIRKALGKEPVLHPYTDPPMLGGLRLRIGDQLIDGSVATRLRRLRQNLLGSGSATIRAKAAGIIEEGSP